MNIRNLDSKETVIFIPLYCTYTTANQVSTCWYNVKIITAFLYHIHAYFFNIESKKKNITNMKLCHMTIFRKLDSLHVTIDLPDCITHHKKSAHISIFSHFVNGKQRICSNRNINIPLGELLCCLLCKICSGVTLFSVV